MRQEALETEILTDSIVENQARTVEFIKSIVCKKYGYPNTSVLSQNTRKGDIKNMRYVCMYLLKKNTHLGIIKIGRLFGKHHSTVVHAEKQLTGYMTYDTKLCNEINEFQDMILMRAKAMANELHNDENYYFLDMDDCASFKFNNKKAIIMIGFSEREQKTLMAKSGLKTDIYQHAKTGLYLCEPKNKLKKVK